MNINTIFSVCIRPLIVSVAVVFLAGCSDENVHQALGTLERDRIALQATVSEVITEIAVKEGATVEVGDLLLRFDDRKQQAIVRRTEAEVKQARAYLTQLQNGAREEDIAAATSTVEAIQAELLEAEKAFSRTATLVDKKLQREADLDTARARRDGLTANLRTAREQLELLKNGTRPEEIVQAEAALEKAQASLMLEHRNLDDYSIVATRSGYLDSFPKNSGERVTAGTTVAVVLAEGAPYARVYIPEPHRVALSVGDSLIVHVDGIEQPYTGTLRWISQEPAFTPHYALNQKERTRLVYMAEVQLPGADKESETAELPTGIPTQVELPL